jgi:threonine synthase
MSEFSTTRGGLEVDLPEAVFRGLAPDGGLFVPTRVPRLPSPSASDDPRIAAGWGHGSQDFLSAARWAAPSFFPTVEQTALDGVVERALDFPVGLVEVEPGRWVLELVHGPTAAFKDVGARFMAALMPVLDEDSASPREGGLRRRTVLVATSGDTGGAVASAFHGIPGYRVVVLFPADGISDRQRRQMTTLGGNVHALAVRGTFDDCQRMVKAAFAESALREGFGLTSANSINVARLLPQAFYYVHAALRLGAAHFVVPSGNLGNLCAGLLAQRAGMPAAGFTAAVNENRGFADFLDGAPFVPGASMPTSSSAMDVGSPSNLERIRWLYGEDDDALRRSVLGGWVGGAETARTIAEVFDRTGYVLDPHTAVAYAVAMRHDPPPDGPVVILSTAHPAKFPETVEAAIGRTVPLAAALRTSTDTPERMTTIDATDAALARALEEKAS